jgi:hypothetical protein
MDVFVFFDTVVAPNCREAKDQPSSFRLVWNAILSLNTIAEALALHNLGYKDVEQNTLTCEATRIRDNYPSLQSLNRCAITLKHVRSIPTKASRNSGTNLTSTSTGISPADIATWIVVIDSKTCKLHEILEIAFETASSLVASAKKPS